LAGGSPDLVIGGPGNDAMNGGKSLIDGAIYLFAPTGINANLETGQIAGDGVDTVEAIESVAGSPFDDVIVGSSGDDMFTPVGGDDQVDGNGGIDAILYGFAPGPVQVDFTAGTGAGEGNDTLTGITAVLGSNFNDTLRGDEGDDLILGGAGNDDIDAFGGNDYILPDAGNDSVDGGEGVLDYVAFSGSTVGIVADIAAGTATGEGTDSLAGTEGIVGSDFDDTITGGPLADFMFGGLGNDQLSGRGGNDGMDGQDGTDVVDGGDGSDSCLAETVTTCESSGSPEEPPLQAFFRRHF
jgi:Ca2+-binding RTX toxin-like protein